MRVGVVFGGDGSERDVSCASAAQVVPALRRRGYDVVLIDASSGLVSVDDEFRFLKSEVRLAAPATINRSRLQMQESLQNVLAAIADVDLVFLAMHGDTAEDGRLPALFDLAGVPVTGSGHVASSVTMDKDLSKRLFQTAGIVTPAWILEPATVDDVMEKLGLPVVVKPVSEGSTVGVTVSQTAAQVAEALSIAGRYGRVMAEEYVYGRELTVGVLDDEPLAVGEIHIPEATVFTYENKYQGQTRETFPADLPVEVAEELRRAAQVAHRILGISGYSRSDFILDDTGEGWLIETNNLPGLTGTSLLPQSAAAAGIEYDELCDRICRLALG